MNQEDIPKIIHYCWFGSNKFSELNIKCINSWKEILPEYKIMFWSEENFDINSNRYVKEAYEAKKFAFVSDYVRLFALERYGGVYFDTDIEVIKNIDVFLNNHLFFGIDNTGKIQSSIIGSVPHNYYINEWLEYYSDISFINDNGKYDITPNVDVITKIILKDNKINEKQIEIIDNEVYIYPKEYFFPINSRTYEEDITPNTYTIHHYEATWLDNKDKFKIKSKKMIKRLFGVNFLKFIRNLKNKL